MRWIRELFNPAAKCARIGHRKTEGWRRTYRRPEGREVRQYVVMGCRETRTECGRCNAPLSDWNVIERTGYHESMMPSDMAEELRRNGVVQTN